MSDNPTSEYRTIVVYAVAEVGNEDEALNSADAYAALAELLQHCADERRAGRTVGYTALESGQAIRSFTLDAKKGWLDRGEVTSG